MLLTVCKSKIHGARVTEANLSYQGSLGIDALLMKAAGLLPYERVQVVNLNNGERFETYCIQQPAGSGDICVNGAAARLAVVGDVLLIIAYAQASCDELSGFSPRLVFLDSDNRLSEAHAAHRGCDAAGGGSQGAVRHIGSS